MGSTMSPKLNIVAQSKGPVMTVLQEFYKVGPGPSSSHTIGPMRITYDFYQRAAKLPADKLWATVYAEDDEAYDIWKNVIGLPAERIVRIGDNKGARFASDNFWMMGDTGPCGPCSEIHYDMGAIASDQGHTDCQFGCECGRYVEIWNLVFMQFDRDSSGKLTPLPKPSIDTGMGLERVTAVLQGVISNYETDLFTSLIKRAAELSGASGRDSRSTREASLRGADECVRPYMGRCGRTNL